MLTGKLEKFIDTKWRAVPERERLQLTKTDGQVQLSAFQNFAFFTTMLLLH